MPRLFISLDFPSHIEEQLLELCDLSLDSASWVDPAHMHLTLRFIGDVDETMFDDVIHALGGIHLSEFPLSLKEVGFFPPRKQPRILWAGVEKNEMLLLLRNKIESRLRRLQLPPDKRKFHPHITLARLRNGSAAEVGMYLSQYNLFHTEPFFITEFSLYSSVLTPRGAIHSQEATYPLLSKTSDLVNNI
ncbi:MAG: RNA 2',3'-cyclic phosphodiesterase [SAR324 cluster bacterium]|nr:RNA 2',3'-cyclic phosphodiesterase [SAR324 cluster bacterium]